MTGLVKSSSFKSEFKSDKSSANLPLTFLVNLHLHFGDSRNLFSSHGLLASTYSFTASANAMMSRRARAYSRFSYCSAMVSLSAASFASNALSATSFRRPSKRLDRKPDARAAMLTYLPTRSLLTRLIKSCRFKSMSSILLLSLAAM